MHYMKCLIEKILVKAPVFILMTLIISTVYYDYYDNTLYNVYAIINQITGISLISAAYMVFYVIRYGNCCYCRLSCFGILWYVVLNTTYVVFNIPYNTYLSITEISGMVLFSILSLLVFIKKYRKCKTKH